jgi:hypothetical protein
MNPTVSFAKSRSTGEPATVEAQSRLHVSSTITALPRTRVIQVNPNMDFPSAAAPFSNLSMTLVTIAPASGRLHACIWRK